MAVTGWTCLNCAAPAPLDDVRVELVTRCQRCGFLFPRPSHPDEDPEWRELDALAETCTDKWAEVCVERYLVLRTLSAGAQGKILLARHRHLDRLCVIKVISAPEDDEWHDIAVARLRTEARAGFSVNHPNVARVLDCDCVNGSWYFAMEYVDGVNLRRLVQEFDQLAWEQVVQIGLQAAAGLEAVHEADLVHRDVKPANLMLNWKGQVKLMDLGLVKIRSGAGAEAVTHFGQLLGTPFYMSPEHFDPEGELDHRADFYSLGATLYHLLVGRPPFRGVGVIDLSKKHRHEPVVWPQDEEDRPPAWLKQVIETCLAKQPEHRYESATALFEALETGLHAGTAVGVPLPRSADPVRGVAVLPFENLSRREADDWIGDAVADYVSSRLMALGHLHIADRHNLVQTLDRTSPSGRTGIQVERILAAANMVGAGTVFAGSYQLVGGKLRIIARMLTHGRPEPEYVAEAVGDLEDLFNLEDLVATSVVERVSREMASPVPAGGGSESMEATEKLVLAKRAFADANYREAIRLGEEAIRRDPRFLDPISLVGACYARCGEYDKAIEYHQREEFLARSLNNKPRLAEAFSNLGVMYYYQGAYALAHEFLEKAKLISVECNLPSDTAKYSGNLGFVLLRLDRLNEAEKALAEAIEINRRHGDLVSLIWPYNGMGSVLLRQKRYYEAREYYSRALVLAREVCDRVNVGVSHMNLARCACLTGEYDQAQEQFDRALESLEGTNFWNGLTLVYEHLAELHLTTNRFDKAMECIDQRIALAAKHRNNRLEASGWEQKARAYELVGDTEAALRCLKHSIEVSQRPQPYESLHQYLEQVARRSSFQD